MEEVSNLLVCVLFCLSSGLGTVAARLAEGDSLEQTISDTSLRSLHELREQGLLCDAVLRLEDGSSLPVHRALLSASSSYFRAVFTTTLHREEQKEVSLAGIDPEIARALVRYVYLRRLGVTRANVTKLLTAADYLALLGVRRLCSDYLQGLIAPETCVSILLYARDHFCPELEKEARNYVLRNFVEVSQHSPDLLELGVDEVRELIGSDELNVKNEESVWEFLVKWVEKEPDARKNHLPQLIGLIRLGLMNEGYFLEKVKEHKYISGNESCRPIIIDTLRFLYDLEMIGQSSSEVSTPAIARPRIPHEVLFAIGGWSGGSPTSCIETYDTRADRWVRVAEVDPSGPRAYHGTAVIGQDIYVIGGFDGIEYFNSCRCFNAATKTWREVAPMNTKRCYVSVAVLNDVIYAMGGYDGHHRQNTAEKYDFKTNQWSMIAPMNAQRSDASATTLNGKIYITGGFNGQECLNSAEVYDPDLNNWSTIPPMRSRRSGVSCIGYQSCLYVIGGFNGISRMCSGEKFNPATITWSSIPDMYNPRSNFAIEVIDDMIFTIGGFNGVTTIYHVECYDGKTNDWYEATDMNIYRSALSASVMYALPNLREYIYPHRDQLMEEKRLKMLAHEQPSPGAGLPTPPQQNQMKEAGVMLLKRSALACAVIRGLPYSNIFADRESMMVEELGRRLHSSGDHNCIMHQPDLLSGHSQASEVQDYLQGIQQNFQGLLGMVQNVQNEETQQSNEEDVLAEDELLLHGFHEEAPPLGEQESADGDEADILISLLEQKLWLGGTDFEDNDDVLEEEVGELDEEKQEEEEIAQVQSADDHSEISD